LRSLRPLELLILVESHLRAVNVRVLIRFERTFCTSMHSRGTNSSGRCQLWVPGRTRSLNGDTTRCRSMPSSLRGTCATTTTATYV
jgi:hypothetical protein